MGIINWVQNRFSGRTEVKRPDRAAIGPARNVAARESCQEAVHEESGHLTNVQCPQGLLSIGTFGNEEPKQEGGRASQELLEFTIEEVKKLQDALTRVLRRVKSKSSSRGSEASADMPLDRFLNCPSSLEVDRRIARKHQKCTANNGHDDDHGEDHGDLSPNTKIILSKARDLLINSSNDNSIKQKSFKFLLKKLFVCGGGGFAPSPSLKDSVESRMEKFFRTVLGKKMNGRQSNAATTRKYFLEDKWMGNMQRDGRRCEEKGEESSKWDRTDSDFIVLEI